MIRYCEYYRHGTICIAGAKCEICFCKRMHHIPIREEASQWDQAAFPLIMTMNKWSQRLAGCQGGCCIRNREKRVLAMTTIMQTSTQHIANKFSWADKEYKTAYGSNASCFAKEKNCYDSWEEQRSCLKSMRTSQISAMLKSHWYAANQDKESG